MKPEIQLPPASAPRASLGPGEWEKGIGGGWGLEVHTPLPFQPHPSPSRYLLMGQALGTSEPGPLSQSGAPKAPPSPK